MFEENKKTQEEYFKIAYSLFKTIGYFMYTFKKININIKNIKML